MLVAEVGVNSSNAGYYRLLDRSTDTRLYYLITKPVCACLPGDDKNYLHTQYLFRHSTATQELQKMLRIKSELQVS